MHEMSTIVRMVNMACETARREGGGRLRSLSIRVGAMTGILPCYLEKYFPEASKGTPAEGAILKITEVPVTVSCMDCGTVYEPEKTPGRRCPRCGSIRGHVQTGRGWCWIRLNWRRRRRRPEETCEQTGRKVIPARWQIESTERWYEDG